MNDNIAVVSDKKMVAYFLKYGFKPIDIFYHNKSGAIMFCYDKTITAEIFKRYRTEYKQK